jgi:predicted ATPase
MADFSSATITIDAPLAQVSETLFDIEKYPMWSTAITNTTVVTRDDAGRVLQVKMTINAGMMKDHVVLDYDWAQAPERLTFSLNDADLLTAMDGAYVIKAIDADTTEVSYELSVAISMPVPAIMRQKAEKTTIDQALAQLKAHLEG